MNAADPSQVVASQADWDELNERLRDLVDELLAADSFCAADPPDSNGRGIYLFSEGERPIYVGRTSITARSRKAERPPSTSFSTRWKQHCNEKSAPNAASLAMKIARQVADHFGVADPKELKKQGGIKRVADWWDLRNTDPPPDFFLVFQAAKEFVRENLDFRFVAISDDIRGVRSHVAEVYADVVLQTEYGDFSTS